MEIKTIVKYHRRPFDESVNEALADGWNLEKRYRVYDPSSGDHFYIAEMYRDPDEELEIKVKYFTDLDDDFRPLEKIAVGDWIDLRASESVTIRKGQVETLRLGVGMILPPGYEAIVAPRSSTPKTYGAMLANSIGVIDNSYSGDGDEWRFTAYAIRDVDIDRGDRIAQFRIVKSMPPVKITTVDHLNDKNRGGLGSTGKK